MVRLPADFSRWAGLAAAVLISGAGCDFGAGRTLGEAPRLLASAPEDGAEGVDRRIQLRLRFDQLLNPARVNRATVRLRSGAVSTLLAVTYDPLAREIRAQHFGGDVLEPRTRYEVVLEGIESLDGVPIERTTVSFHTGDSVAPYPELPMVNFDTVAGLFEARCATSDCHRAPDPPLGLDLSSADAIARTAIGVISRHGGGHDRLSRTGLWGLPIIDVVGDRGRAGTSYLIYKVLGADAAGGSPMPPARSELAPLSVDEIRQLVDWIQAGAALD